jgi:3-hydroxyisobutyrate dehydrogenase
MTPMTEHERIAPGDRVGFVGLGRMGRPMAGLLARAGYRVTGYDVSASARHSWASQAPGTAAGELLAVAGGAAAVVLMLPDSAAVSDVLTSGGLLAALPAGAMVIDMSSSQPQATRRLAAAAAERGVVLVDAPVSGGVTGAQQGTLTIMAGGAAAHVDRARGLLEVLGSRVVHVGDVGAGHAVKAINNLVAATNLLALAEAMLAAAEFGLDVPTVLATINTSTGQSWSSANNWPNFMLTGSFGSGFALRLMLKDVQTALGILDEAGTPARLSALAAQVWAEAAAALPPDADHTEIARWLAPRQFPG